MKVSPWCALKACAVAAGSAVVVGTVFMGLGFRPSDEPVVGIASILAAEIYSCNSQGLLAPLTEQNVVRAHAGTVRLQLGLPRPLSFLQQPFCASQ